MSEFYTYPNRLVCSVLDEMRKLVNCLKEARNTNGEIDYHVDRFIPSMSMLIEESQTLVNRMEAALEDWSDIRRAKEEIKKLEQQISELKSGKK